MQLSAETEHNSEEERSLIYAIVHGNAPQYAVLVERFHARLYWHGNTDPGLRMREDRWRNKHKAKSLAIFAFGCMSTSKQI